MREHSFLPASSFLDQICGHVNNRRGWPLVGPGGTWNNHFGKWESKHMVLWLVITYLKVIVASLNETSQYVVVIVVQSLSHVHFFTTPWTAAHHASLSFAISQSVLRLTSIESMMPSNHLIFCCPFSCPQSFPASRSFPKSQLFASDGQSIGA